MLGTGQSAPAQCYKSYLTLHHLKQPSSHTLANMSPQNQVQVMTSLDIPSRSFFFTKLIRKYSFQISFLLHLFPYVERREISQKAGWSADGGKKGVRIRLTFCLQPQEAFVILLKSHCQQPKKNLISYRLKGRYKSCIWRGTTPGIYGDTVCPIYGNATQLAHVRCFPLKFPCPSLQRYFPAIYSQPVQVPGFITPLGQGMAFHCAEFHKVLYNPFLELFEVPLKGSTPIWCIRYVSSFPSSENTLFSFNFSAFYLLSYLFINLF